MIRKVLILIVFSTMVCYAGVFERIDTFDNRRGRVQTYPIHTGVSLDGSSSEGGKKGTWAYEAGYLYIWIEDGVAMRVALEYFGGSRFRTVEDHLPIQTVAGENFRTVETFTP